MIETIDDCRGGMSELDPAFLLPNQVAEAYNLTYWNSRLGARRNGMSSLSTAATQATTSLAIYTPDSTVANERALTTEATGGGATEWYRYTPAFAARTAITPSPADLFDGISRPVSTANLAGKLFIGCYALTAASAALDRLHVWDGTDLRRVGLAAPSAAAPGPSRARATTACGTRARRPRSRFCAASPRRR